VTNHPAEHGIEFDVVIAAPRSPERGNFRLFFPANQLIQRFAKDRENSKETGDGNHYFQVRFQFVLALPA
jgi:hypothetical protein